MPKTTREIATKIRPRDFIIRGLCRSHSVSPTLRSLHELGRHVAANQARHRKPRRLQSNRSLLTLAHRTPFEFFLTTTYHARCHLSRSPNEDHAANALSYGFSLYRGVDCALSVTKPVHYSGQLAVQ